MKGSDHLGPVVNQGISFASGALLPLAIGFILLLTVPAGAQINGTWASVTSIPASHFLPNPSPSVTSLGPFGFGRGVPSNLGSAPNVQQFPFRQFPFTRQRGRGNGFGGGYGYSYAMPYYVPYDASGYGYDYVAPADQYSGPVGPNGPTLHIVVEQPPLAPQPYVSAEADHSSVRRAQPPNPEPPVAAQPEEHPVDPTVLVFRDGRKQEVSNYAIMGQMVYLFGEHPKKIGLAELDVPATVKANDDRGLEFKVPVQSSIKQKSTALPNQSAPATNSQKPSSKV